MAVVLSKTAQILIKDHSSTSGTPSVLGSLTSWSIDESCSEIDVTGCADTNKQYIPGQADAKGEFTVFINSGDTAQGLLETAHNGSTLVDIYYREEGTGSGKKQLLIPAYITTYSKSAAVDAGIELSIGFVAGGTIDRTAQASA